MQRFPVGPPHGLGDKAMGQQFKVGDRVRLVRDTDDGKLKAGATGTVLEAESRYPFAEWDGLGSGHNGPLDDDRTSCWAVCAGDLRKIGVPTAESLLLALGTASRELEDAITAERDAHAAVEAAATRRARASEAHAEALKAVREAAWAKAAA